MSFKAMLLLLLFSIVLAKADLDPNTILKTIVSGKETIDCVDIYKQPAFNHPLLKNHTLQLKPSSYPVESNSRVSAELTQKWHESGEFCPEGTVAVLRSPRKNTTNTNSSPSYISNNYAMAFMGGERGGSADLNVWRPHAGADEISKAHIRMSDGKTESVEAGWKVGPESQIEPVIYTYWTNNGANGCYNLDCPGFVHVSPKFALGAEINPISRYGGEQYKFNLRIVKDLELGNWWLFTEKAEIGYWPKNLFYNLRDRPSTLLEWGGRAIKTHEYTIVEMGSGHFASEGFEKAAYFGHLAYAPDGLDIWIKPRLDELDTLANRPDCYDVKPPSFQVSYGTFFFYGGPGIHC